MEKGQSSSEFKLTIVHIIVGMAVLKGYLTPEDAGIQTDQLTILVGAIISIVPTVVYTLGRIGIKIKHIVSNTPSEPPKIKEKVVEEQIAEPVVAAPKKTIKKVATEPVVKETPAKAPVKTKAKAEVKKKKADSGSISIA